MKNQIYNKIFSVFILLFSAVVLFASVIVLIKYFIVTLSGLHDPVFKLVKSILSEENTKKDLIPQIIVIFKLISLIISGGLILVIYSTLSTVFSCIFYKFCSRKHKTINHPLEFSIIKGIKWNFYRLFLVLMPPFLVKAIATVLLAASILLFNFLLKIVAISVSLTAFIMSFISFGLMFLFMLSLIVSFWQIFSTLFGTEIAVSEPRLKNKTIEKRSKKLILANHYNILLCISYFMINLIIIFQIKYALTTDFLINSLNQKVFNQVIIFNLLCILVFEYFKTSGYVNSLIEYNHKISKCPIKVITS